MEVLEELLGFGVVGADLEGFLEGGDGFRFPTELGEDGGAGVGDAGVGGVGGFALRKGLEGGLDLLGLVSGEAEVVPRTGEAGVGLHGGLESGDGLRHVAELAVGEAEFVMVVGLIGGEADGIA